MADRVDSYFEAQGIDVNTILDDISKYLPFDFFSEPELKSIEVVIPSNSTGKWFMLPFKSWNVLGFRNGKITQSNTQDAVLATLDQNTQAITVYDDFWCCPFGDGFIVPTYAEPYKIRVMLYGIEKSSATMKQLPKLEFKNLFMNLLIVNSNSVFDGLKRIKTLFGNIKSENLQIRHGYSPNTDIKGFVL